MRCWSDPMSLLTNLVTSAELESHSKKKLYDVSRWKQTGAYAKRELLASDEQSKVLIEPYKQTHPISRGTREVNGPYGQRLDTLFVQQSWISPRRHKQTHKRTRRFIQLLHSSTQPFLLLRLPHVDLSNYERKLALTEKHLAKNECHVQTSIVLTTMLFKLNCANWASACVRPNWRSIRDWLVGTAHCRRFLP
jgi:hypothetical protein